MPLPERSPNLITLQLSKGMDDLPDVRWDYLVTMGCGDACPHLPARRRLDWNLPNPKHLDDDGFCAVRDRIGGLVKDLISDATAESPARERRDG